MNLNIHSTPGTSSPEKKLILYSTGPREMDLDPHMSDIPTLQLHVPIDDEQSSSSCTINISHHQLPPIPPPPQHNNNPPKVVFPRQIDFYTKIIANEELCVRFLRERNLLPGGDKEGSGFCVREKNGKICGGILRDYTRSNRNGTKSKALRCNKLGCGTIVSLRKYCKFFTYTDMHGRCSNNMSLCQILEVVWFWCHLQSPPVTAELTGRTISTVYTWYNLCREICDFMFQLRSPMGGEEEIVYVDEFLVSSPSSDRYNDNPKGAVCNVPLPDELNEKVNYGNRIEGPWILGIRWKHPVRDEESETVSNLTEVRYFALDNRDIESIISIIQQEVMLGTTICTDNWNAYHNLPNYGYRHNVVQGRPPLVFIDEDTGQHTEAVERLWFQIKGKYTLKSGPSNHLNLILREEWWRSMNPDDLFNAFLRDLKVVYCSNEVDESTQQLDLP